MMAKSLSFFIAGLMVFSLTISAKNKSIEGFSEDWSNGICNDRWLLFRNQWGGDNNGCVPEVVCVEQDLVDGVRKNVVVIATQGNKTKSSISGVKKVREKASSGFFPSGNPQRVGGCIATKEYFASGAFEVKMKIGMTNDSPPQAPGGLCPSIWLFHYEEHFGAPGDPTGDMLNPFDPLYQPYFKEGDLDDGFYSTVNSEIDMPELGHEGKFNVGWYNTYLSEVVATASQQIEYPASINILDGNYHTYRTEWHTELAPTTLNDGQVVPVGNYYYAATLNPSSAGIQGMSVVKNEKDNLWYVYKGMSATYFIDGQKIGESSQYIPCVSARLIIGGWFPDPSAWKGLPAPDWDEAKIYISDVTITPYNDEGDVLNQFESYPIGGLVPAAQTNCKNSQ